MNENELGPEIWGSAILSAREDEADEAIVTLRPSRFDEYIGQLHVKQNLQISCGAAKRRGEALDHVLLHGPPGLGKTSLAKILASELGVGFKSTSGPVLEKPGDLAAILTSLEEHSVLFIDEIHRLPRTIEEILYPAMEDFELDIIIGQGVTAKSIKIPVKPFTLVGATTRSGMLTSPLRARFGIVHKLDFYSETELAEIVRRSAGILEVKISDAASDIIAKRSRGTPRVANRLLKRIRDFADEMRNGEITEDVANDALKLLDVDEVGLERADRAFLDLIIDKFEGGPVGIDTLSAAIGEERDTLEDVYEPYLLQEGFIQRTPRGRMATERAYQHLGKKIKPEIVKKQLSLDIEQGD